MFIIELSLCKQTSGIIELSIVIPVPAAMMNCTSSEDSSPDHTNERNTEDEGTCGACASPGACADVLFGKSVVCFEFLKIRSKDQLPLELYHRL